MRDDLHALSKVFAGAFLAQHFLVDLAGGDVCLLAQIHVKETLIVADVEIGFGTVFGDIDFTMLEWIHSARINVDVRIELLLQNLDAAATKQATEGGGGQTFAERGNDATGDENMLGNVLLRIAMLSSNHGTSVYQRHETRRVFFNTKRRGHHCLDGPA